jgi:type IV pilus assembly protein PilM
VLFRNAKSVIGLDIGSSAIKAIELKPLGRGFKVASFGTVPVPPESIVDGNILDSIAVAEAIRHVLESQKMRTKEVATSLSGNAVIVKRIAVPAMTEAELADSIYWEAEQYIPFDIQDVTLDYQVIRNGKPPTASGTMDVLLVAAKNEKIADYTNVIAQAGRVPVVLDIDAFALQNAYELNYDVDESRVVLLLDAGASSININVVRGTQSLFTRDISMGGNDYDEALERELSLPRASAEEVKKGEALGGVTPEQTRPVLDSVTENVMLEIQKTFDFFKATGASDHLDQIMLSGGASQLVGLAGVLEERFETPVMTLDPFRHVTVDERKAAMLAALEAGPAATIAMGLAVRKAGDR